MKPMLTLSIALLAAMPCLGQTSRYDPATSILDIPCVALYQNAVPVFDDKGIAITYQLQLKRVGNNEVVLVGDLLRATSADECLGRYDSATRIYTDAVTMDDNTYRATMTLKTGTSLTLNSAPLIGPGKTSLWTVTKGAHTLYLAGGMHALRPTDYPLPRAFDEAYAKASVMYFEIDRDDPVETGANLTQAEGSLLMQDPEGEKLSEVLDTEIYQLLVSYLTLKNIQPANVEQWSAQMLMNALPVEDVALQLGATAQGLDTYFVGKARADGKAIFGLETSESVRIMLQSVNEGIENELVLTTLSDLVSGKSATELLALLQAWRKGDVTRIQQSSDKVRRENRKDYDLVITHRNNAWLSKIEVLLDTPATEMVIVGATHVAGPEGLITLLRDRGYAVTRY